MKKLIKYGFIAVVMLSFMSCSEKVHDYDWKWGTEKCKDKGGLRFIKVLQGSVACKCHNGDYKWKK